jgi:O-antigen ligase
MQDINRLIFFVIATTVVGTVLLYGTVHQPVIALFYLVIGLMVVGWAVDCGWSGAARFSRHPLQFPLILFGGYALVQIIPFGWRSDTSEVFGAARTISMEPFATQTAALHIFALAAFFALTLVYLESASRIRRLATTIVVFGFAYGFFAILQSVLSPDKIYGIYKPQTATPFGSFVNRHNFAAIMEMAMCLPLGLMFSGAVERDKRLLYAVATALMAASLLLSGSRGGLVAMVSGLVFLVIITSRARGTRSLLLKAGLSLLLIFAGIGGAVFVGGETSLTRFGDAATGEDITSNRTQIWAVTLRVIAANMPLGAGIGAFATAYPEHDDASGLERVDQAHNDYLQVLADAGIPGMLIGGLFLFLFFREGRRSISVENTLRRGIAFGAFAGCFAILVHSLFDFVLHITAVSAMFLTLLALLVASGREYPDDVAEASFGRARHARAANVTPIGRGTTPTS